MQPCLRIDHRQGGGGVPCCVPDKFLPALTLDICRGEELESCAAFFEERGEGRETGFFEIAVNSRVRVETNLKVFGLGVPDVAGLDLCGTDPGLQISTSY